MQERQEQQVAEKQDGIVGVARTTTEMKADNTKTAGKENSIMQSEATKTSIHERLEINKRKIQEKQGKDKPERGADRGVRTV